MEKRSINYRLLLCVCVIVILIPFLLAKSTMIASKTDFFSYEECEETGYSISSDVHVFSMPPILSIYINLVCIIQLGGLRLFLKRISPIISIVEL